MIYRVTPKTIKMTPAYDPSTTQAFQIDFTLPFKIYLPQISRRFGIHQNLIGLIQQFDGTRIFLSFFLSFLLLLLLQKKKKKKKKKKQLILINPCINNELTLKHFSLLNKYFFLFYSVFFFSN